MKKRIAWNSAQTWVTKIVKKTWICSHAAVCLLRKT